MRARFALRLGLLLSAACVSACAGTVRPALSPQRPRTDALLILPGLGYNDAAERTFRSLAPAAAAQGVDLYVADYLTRSGLADSRINLQRFIRENRLSAYQRVHVFAFIAGAWTFNPVADARELPNLTTVVYDRSPLQERAPRIAAERLPFFAWLRYGATIFELSRTPYLPLASDSIKVGLVVETMPTTFIRRHEKTARSYGPLVFGCDTFSQRYEDCMYVAMNHDQLYEHFPELLPELLTFLRTGRFTAGANRQPPADDVLARRRH